MDNKGEKKIQFKPLHSGVGFHPFSDGLPYAPQSKAAAQPIKQPHTPSALPGVRTASVSRPVPSQQTTPLTAPSGATAAGRPVYVAPQKPVQHAHQPQKISPKNEVEVMGGTASMSQSATTVSRTVLTTREKVFAFLFDASVHAIAWLMVVWVMRIAYDSDLLIEIARAQSGIFLTAYAVSQWFWIRLPQTLFGRSAGQAFFS